MKSDVVSFDMMAPYYFHDFIKYYEQVHSYSGELQDDFFLIWMAFIMCKKLPIFSSNYSQHFLFYFFMWSSELFWKFIEK